MVLKKYAFMLFNSKNLLDFILKAVKCMSINKHLAIKIVKILLYRMCTFVMLE